MNAVKDGRMERRKLKLGFKKRGEMKRNTITGTNGERLERKYKLPIQRTFENKIS